MATPPDTAVSVAPDSGVLPALLKAVPLMAVGVLP